MTDGNLPNLKAILICDTVITEVGTNKKSLIGIFENINASSFPCTHYSLSVYVKFTDAQGNYKFKLELVNVSNDVVIGRGEIHQFRAIDKLQVYDLVFNLRGLRFQHPDRYEFRLFANDAIFGQKTFLVQQISKPK